MELDRVYNVDCLIGMREIANESAKELREFVKQWNAKYAKSYYSWNDKVVVMLPTEYQKERVND